MDRQRFAVALRRLLVPLAASLLAGCVTTTETVFTEAPSPDKALTQRIELARKYIGEGNWNDAKRNLAIAARIDDTSAEIHEAFALVYQSTGEYEAAEESYRRAISLDRKFSRARNNYAAFLYGRERFDEAEAQLEEVIKDTLYEARPRAFVNLGLCRLALGNREGAESAFVRTLSMERGNVIALFQLAKLRFNAGDYASASTYYTGYRNAVRRQSAEGLWLGIQLASVTGDRDAEGSYALALKNLYPNSAELAAYERREKEDRRSEKGSN